jgi:hypothetical protein
MDQARQRFTDMQRWFAGSFHTPIYRCKVRQWMADDAALRSVSKRSGIDVFGHRWQAQGWPYIEPVSDAMGDVVQERNLLNSHRRLAAARGIDFEDLIEEIIADRVRIITKADDAAKKLNKKRKLDLTWRDLAQWPMPEGVQIAVGNQPAPNKEEPVNAA